jgi:glucuronate isomerase
MDEQTLNPASSPDYMLSCHRARELYHGIASKCPIIDYHCHLSPELIARDHRFKDLTELWLEGDHYKWRVMRAAGVPEEFITGDSPNKEKFLRFASILPLALRNPVYNWCCMEMVRPLGLGERLLNAKSAEAIWEETRDLLSEPAFSTRGLLGQFDVRVVCTTDDPIDELESHRAIASEGYAVRVLPTFRPDRVLQVGENKDWNGYLDLLGERTGSGIDSFDALIAGMESRLDHFVVHGCRLSDHGLSQLPGLRPHRSHATRAFAAARSGRSLDSEQERILQATILHELAVLYQSRGIAMQLHVGPLRNNSTRLFKGLGRDAGGDSMGDFSHAQAFNTFLDALDAEGNLGKTILYNHNPSDNDVFATAAGNFQGGIPGKIQYGPAWWFMDQRDGILRQLESLSNHGLLGLFIGMLTDSRSFLSFSRHDYFRRILCDVLGREMEAGILPDDSQLVGDLVENVCWRNATKYCGFPEDNASGRRGI